MAEYIASRAESLAARFVRRNPHTLKDLQGEISGTLLEFYSDADKLKFLDYYVAQLDHEMVEHRRTCKQGETCIYEQSYKAAIFYVNQERVEIERSSQERGVRQFGSFIGTLNVSGQGTVLNLGKISGDINNNVHILQDQGHKEISDSIAALTKAINDAADINDKEKIEYLEQLDLLSSQATLPEQDRMPKSALKNVIKFGLGTLNALSSVSTVTGVTLPQIAQFFLG